jgi:hypothetical protein
MYCIDDMQSEPHHQHQNPAERRIQDIKKVSNHLMDRTGTPAEYWLLSLLHTTYVLNRLATEKLNWLTPYEKATGQQPDISAILAFFIGGNLFTMLPRLHTLTPRNVWVVWLALLNIKEML